MKSTLSHLIQSLRRQLKCDNRRPAIFSPNRWQYNQLNHTRRSAENLESMRIISCLSSLGNIHRFGHRARSPRNKDWAVTKEPEGAPCWHQSSVWKKWKRRYWTGGVDVKNPTTQIQASWCLLPGNQMVRKANGNRNYSCILHHCM